MSECPSCRIEIGSSSYCGCGWKRKAMVSADKPQEQTVKCCYDVCFLGAKVKIKTKTGWANMCLRHYDEYHQQQSEDYCAALGLNTTEQRRAWFRDQVNRLSNKFTRYAREPGSDFEEDAA